MRRRSAQACALALALAPLAAVIGHCATSPGIPFIRHSESMPWLMPATPVGGELRQWGRREAPVARYERPFRAEPGEPVRLRVRALGRFQVWLNGTELEEGRGEGQRPVRSVDLSARVRPGPNRLRVDVANRRGPPLLSARLEGAAPDPETDERWRVELEGERLRVIPADDTRINPTSLATETPWEALLRRRDAALLLFLLGALAFAAARRIGHERQRALPWLALGAASLAWVVWLATVVWRLPPALGFDARHHLAYVEWLASRHSLPLATDGWSTFHPPLFYGLAWAGGAAAPRVLPWLAGLGVVWVVFFAARRLFAGDARRQLLAVAFVAVLPMHLYTSAYFSNESLHTLLASAALASTLALLLGSRARPLHAALCGLLFGLAALTKFTALLLLPLALAAILVRAARLERADARRLAELGAAFAVPCLAVAGWYYARNWILLGAPIVGNWELPGPGRIWWQQPGFHTLAWYTGFGESLIHPYLSGYHSFGDAVYSTFWGDGFVAGRVHASDRHGFWSYDFMSMGYWVALPATGLLLAGALEALLGALGSGERRRRLALALLLASSWVVGVAFLYLTLRLPFYAQAKAAYTLPLAGPLAVFFSLGAARLDTWLEPWPLARGLLWGWLSLLFGTLFLGFGVL